MTTINFITNQPLERESGGWCGVSRGLYFALTKKRATINFVGPIEPKVSALQKAHSKALRLCGLPGNFFYFSEHRLRRIKEQVSAVAPRADYDLFFGATSWVSCDLKRPFGAYVDALFPTYMRIYSKQSDFRTKDLERVRRNEQAWLRRASHIFWTSAWSRRDGIRDENLANLPGIVVGIGGNLPPPQRDSFRGEKRILFVSKRFKEKGGYEAFEAFKKVQKKTSDLKFIVIGEQPPSFVSSHPGVETLGMLSKSVPRELERLKKELSRAFCLVHPTKMDVTPCIIIEAGYYGCPAISPASFGIPELIKDRFSGLLLPDPFTVDEIALRIESLLDSEEECKLMRKNVRARSLELFTYEVIADKIIAAIDRRVNA